TSCYKVEYLSLIKEAQRHFIWKFRRHVRRNFTATPRRSGADAGGIEKSFKGTFFVSRGYWIPPGGFSSTQQRERYRIDARRFAVRLRRADGRAAVFPVHLHRRQLVLERKDLPLA